MESESDGPEVLSQTTLTRITFHHFPPDATGRGGYQREQNKIRIFSLENA